MGRGTENNPELIGRGNLFKVRTSKLTVPDFICLGDEEVEIPKEGFDFKLDASGDNILVTPTRNANFQQETWLGDNKWFRSILFNRYDNSVVSVGFPKFFNFNENQKMTDILKTHLANNSRVGFTEKMDGSLMIRSVIDGKVNFRTRGTPHSTVHSELARHVALSKYKKLMDPDFMPKSSILFELVSNRPELKIVLKYPEDDLILIGGVDNSTLEQMTFRELERLSIDNELKIVASKELPRDPASLIESVSEWTNLEGVVARFNNDQDLIKIKSADYLARHRLKYALTAKVIRTVCLERDVNSMDDFTEYLREQGGDWELAEDARPFVDRFLDVKNESKKVVNKLQEEVNVKKQKYTNRGDFARGYASNLPSKEKAVAFSLYDNNKEAAYELLLNRSLKESFKEVESTEASE